MDRLIITLAGTTIRLRQWDVLQRKRGASRTGLIYIDMENGILHVLYTRARQNTYTTIKRTLYVQLGKYTCSTSLNVIYTFSIQVVLTGVLFPKMFCFQKWNPSSLGGNKSLVSSIDGNRKCRLCRGFGCALSFGGSKLILRAFFDLRQESEPRALVRWPK